MKALLKALLLRFPTAAVLLFVLAPGAAAIDPNAVVILHAGTERLESLNCPGTAGSADPNTQDIPCRDYQTTAPLDYTDVYLVVARADQAGIMALECGLNYSNLNEVDWYNCAGGMEIPADGWPASQSADKIWWDTCQTTTIEPDGVHAIAGFFFIYPGGDDLFQVIPTPRNSSLAVLDCSNHQEYLPASAGGAVGFGSVAGFNPCASVPCGQTKHVPSEFATIQAALNVACDGDTVLVADGTYAGAGNVNLEFWANVILASENGASATTIDCTSAASAVRSYFGTAPSPVIQGFTIRNAGDSGVLIGGDSPVIRDCILENNSGYQGGALDFLATHPTVTGCTLRQNTAAYGGAAFLGGGSVATFSNCLVQGNDAGYDAGGILAGGDTLQITDCLLAGNNAVNQGGALVVGASGEAVITGSTIAGNRSGGTGGGITAGDGSMITPSITLARSVVWGNCASLQGFDVYLDNALASFVCSDVGFVDTFSGPPPTSDASTISTDPSFCGPADCNSTPTVNGDYTLRAGSPCLADSSLCGLLIGWGSQGCPPLAAPFPGTPAAFALHPCRPNPFRSNTDIDFDLPRPGPVTLKIYDISGHLVRTLVNTSLGAGRYDIPWSGGDVAGHPVPPGIYFYRLDSGPFHRTLKAVHLG